MRPATPTYFTGFPAQSQVKIRQTRRILSTAMIAGADPPFSGRSGRVCRFPERRLATALCSSRSDFEDRLWALDDAIDPESAFVSIISDLTRVARILLTCCKKH